MQFQISIRKNELGRHDEANKIFKVALSLLAALGLIVSIVLFVNAEHFAIFLKNPAAQVAIMYVAPAIFTVSLGGALRGYFQGMQNMTPSAVSQVTEQLLK